MSNLTEDSFLKDVENHKIKILHDDGVYRHIRFSNQGSSVMRFDLITAPGLLLYRGDMGCYEFERLHDMFNLFRNDKKEYHLKMGRKIPINEGYWAEKLESIDKDSGYKKYSSELFLETVERLAIDYLESNPDIDEDDFRWELTDEVLSKSEFEVEAYHAASDFRFNDDEVFSDFWEITLTETAYRYTWACYAIVWGIDRYDEVKL